MKSLFVAIFSVFSLSGLFLPQKAVSGVADSPGTLAVDCGDAPKDMSAFAANCEVFRSELIRQWNENKPQASLILSIFPLTMEFAHAAPQGWVFYGFIYLHGKIESEFPVVFSPEADSLESKVHKLAARDLVLKKIPEAERVARAFAETGVEPFSLSFWQDAEQARRSGAINVTPKAPPPDKDFVQVWAMANLLKRWLWEHQPYKTARIDVEQDAKNKRKFTIAVRIRGGEPFDYQFVMAGDAKASANANFVSLVGLLQEGIE